ncbi:hypothetical protein GCM10010521_22170 [Streptomyces rameus]|uniref:Apea-like HEPN domain-containing protein n=1 Tax=Streptomyces rameus TaxID=68261 RepID=A0ABP6N3X8_9ACTN
MPADVPKAARTVLRTARELLRQSYYYYEFSTVAVMHSLIAVEIVLRDRIPDAGTEPLFQLIKQGAADGILTARQAEYLDYGRQIRNGMAHGKTTHAVMPPALAVPMVTTSFAIVSELCEAVRLGDPPASCDSELEPIAIKVGPQRRCADRSLSAGKQLSRGTANG